MQPTLSNLGPSICALQPPGPVSVGVVAALWRFPVKSMGGERLREAEFTSTGVLGDRAFALIDVETGKVASAKSVRLFSVLLDCKAAFVAPVRPGHDLPAVQITLPGGRIVRSDDAEDAGRALSGLVGRPVRLTRAAPNNFIIDQYHPDIEGVDPRGYRNQTAEQPLGAALFAELGACRAQERRPGHAARR